jgi:hypothetical protein
VLLSQHGQEFLVAFIRKRKTGGHALEGNGRISYAFLPFVLVKKCNGPKVDVCEWGERRYNVRTDIVETYSMIYSFDLII